MLVLSCPHYQYILWVCFEFSISSLNTDDKAKIQNSLPRHFNYIDMWYLLYKSTRVIHVICFLFIYISIRNVCKKLCHWCYLGLLKAEILFCIICVDKNVLLSIYAKWCYNSFLGHTYKLQLTSIEKTNNVKNEINNSFHCFRLILVSTSICCFSVFSKLKSGTPLFSYIVSQQFILQ